METVSLILGNTLHSYHSVKLYINLCSTTGVCCTVIKETQMQLEKMYTSDMENASEIFQKEKKSMNPSCMRKLCVLIKCAVTGFA